MAESNETETKVPDAGTAVAPARPKRRAATKPAPRRRPRHKGLPPWNVVLLDDDQHTYAYVIEMLGHVFGHPLSKSFLMAEEVDRQGRVIVMTTHRELAELKREQIIAYGTDPRIGTCKGSMTAVIEPAR